MKLTATFLLATFCAYAQFVLTKEQMIAYTPDNPFERFADGRPKVPDDLLEKVKGLVIEEVYGTVKGKGGVSYGRRSALCLETQHFPDSPNHPDFPTTELKPKQKYHTTTVFKFSAR